MGIFLKNSIASSTVKFKISYIVFSLYFTNSVSELYLFPTHSSHLTYTSGKNCISIFFTPHPSHASHLPPLTLKENLPWEYPISLDLIVFENNCLIGVNALTYIAALDLGVLPIGDWSIPITLSIYSIPVISSYFPGSSFP